VRLRERQSPNHGPRRNGLSPELVVIHYTGMQSAEAALDRLCDPGAEVSAHYLIDYDGTVWALVREEMRAWHAGAGGWGGAGDVNSRSIGIELANTGAEPFGVRQMAALENLLGGVMDRWAIRPRGVIAHSDMAPERKADPGPRFDWRRLARAGLSVWPEAEGEAGEVETDRFSALARRFGYPPADADALLSAVRYRFRPWAAGVLDAADMAVVSDLAARFPIDRAAGTA
jgi:N-acetylmuramoyl-L-alanine amidase